jgi:hypothetical protein
MKTEIIDIEAGIEMLKTIMSGIAVIMTFDLSSWLELEDGKTYVVVADLGLRYTSGGRYENFYSVINESGKIVDVSGAYCEPIIRG